MKTILSLIAATLLLAGPAASATVTVCPSGCDFTSIRAAIDGSAADDILVHDGTYAVTSMGTSVKFPSRNLTIRSLNGPAKTIIDGTGSTFALVTFIGSGTAYQWTLAGFTVTGADLIGTPFSAIVISKASPTISNCRVHENRSSNRGGGIAIAGGASPTITSTTIAACESKAEGGGISVTDSTLTVTDCAFVSNFAVAGGGIYGDGAVIAVIGSHFLGNAAGHGGGIGADGSNLAVSGSAFTDNRGTLGGGVYAYAAGAPTELQLADSSFTGNSGSSSGGGVYASNVSGLITGCTVADNVTPDRGGGISLVGPATPVVGRCSVTGNDASDGGGIAVLGAASCEITTSALTGNRGAGGGGGLWVLAGSVVATGGLTVSGNLPDGVRVADTSVGTMTGSIVWGNGVMSGGDEIVTIDGGLFFAEGSDVEGGWPGDGNTNTDPLFLDPVDAADAPTSVGDYRLTNDSACIDTARPGDVGTRDLAGHARPQGLGPDRGAFEASPLRNGFVEGTGRRPASWRGVNLLASDKLTSLDAADGRASFVFSGGSTLVRSIKQTRPLAVAAGKKLVLSGWCRAWGVPAARGLLDLQLTVIFLDGRKKSVSVPFTRGTHGWEYRETSLVLPKGVAKVTVQARFRQPRGRAWFDGIQLFVE